MQEYLGYGYQAQSTSAFVNPYAAMPSLHFGWDLLLGAGIVWASWGRRWMWFTLPIGIFLPISQIPSITVTANHYFIDAAAGAVVALMGFPAALALRRWGYPALGRGLERLPMPALRRWFLVDDEPGSETGAGLNAASLGYGDRITPSSSLLQGVALDRAHWPDPKGAAGGSEWRLSFQRGLRGGHVAFHRPRRVGARRTARRTARHRRLPVRFRVEG